MKCSKIISVALSLIIALSLVFAMSVVAFADEAPAAETAASAEAETTVDNTTSTWQFPSQKPQKAWLVSPKQQAKSTLL